MTSRDTYFAYIKNPNISDTKHLRYRNWKRYWGSSGNVVLLQLKKEKRFFHCSGTLRPAVCGTSETSEHLCYGNVNVCCGNTRASALISRYSFSTSISGPSRWDGDEDPGKIRFIVPKFWEKNRMRSETQPYSTVLQYGCVALRMRFFPQNFGTIINN